MICSLSFVEPAVALFLSQVAAAVLAVQAVHGLVVAAAPWHAHAVERLGPRGAALLASLFPTLLAHAIGTLMTVPALVGVKLGKIQVNRVATLPRLLQSMPLVLLNLALTLVVSAAVTVLSTPEAVLRDITAGLPSRWTVAWQTAVFLLLTEVWFYHVHRLFHENKTLYKLVHKLHHTWTAPVALVGTFANPVEHLGCNLASVLWGPYICGAHVTVAWAYAFVFAVGAYAHHCGYWTDDMGMHDLHHEAFNVNYGNAHILDYLYGTYRLKDAARSTPSAASEGQAAQRTELHTAQGMAKVD